jgi:hypothetical protein
MYVLHNMFPVNRFAFMVLLESEAYDITILSLCPSV